VTELLDAADWVYRTMKLDDDVRAVFIHAYVGRGYANLGEFIKADPEHFLALVEAAKDMLAQLPDPQEKPYG
jgi:hypothetical protein